MEATLYAAFTNAQSRLMNNNDAPMELIDPYETINMIGETERTFSDYWTFAKQKYGGAVWEEHGFVRSLHDSQSRVNSVIKLAQYRAMKKIGMACAASV